MYMARGAVGSAYGAAGALVVLLFWVYYSAQIFFFGAEITQTYALRYGSGWRGRRGFRVRDGGRILEEEEEADPERPRADS
jgi:membrane protein